VDRPSEALRRAGAHQSAPPAAFAALRAPPLTRSRKRRDPLPLPPPPSPSAGALATRDVLAEVARRLDRASLGALRATCSAVKRAVDATLSAADPPHAAPLPALCALLAQTPLLRELSLASCADGCVRGWPFAFTVASFPCSAVAVDCSSSRPPVAVAEAPLLTTPIETN
jgi:hypothetical protein